MTACPGCGAPLGPDAYACRGCLRVVDAGRHAAGRLGADGQGRGRPLEDPAPAPLPLTDGGMTGGLAGSALRLATPLVLLRRRRARRRARS